MEFFMVLTDFYSTIRRKNKESPAWIMKQSTEIWNEIWVKIMQFYHKVFCNLLLKQAWLFLILHKD